jgi:putative transposase
MDLTVNQLFQWCDEGARIERILWIEPSGQHLVTIDVADGRAWPTLMKRSFVERRVTHGDIRLLDADMFAYLRQPDSAFPLSHLEQRDRAWRIIEGIVAHQEGGEGSVDRTIFHPSILGPIVQALVERTGRSKRWVRTCLRRYWQRGQVKNALLPRADRRITGKKEQKSPDRHAVKLGRPSMVAKYTGIATGVNIDDTIKECFRRGTKLYREQAEKITLKGAYARTLTLFFHQGKELRNGRFLPLLPPAAELPTWNQYQYWYRQQDDLTYSVTSPVGPKALDAGERPPLGYPRQRLLAPGRPCEIHVVIGDFNLVSMLDRRRSLGRPVIYVIVDVFSELIAGMSVSLGGPSRHGALLALDNMAHDKVAFCSEYGVDITQADWPGHHLPQTILAGRCKPLLESADILLKALGIEVSNSQPCRVDWRESLERCFPLCDDTTIDWESGPVSNLSESGRRSQRLDGCLTLNEFRRLVIECIIEHNIAQRLSDDDLSQDMIEDGIEPYPRDLWAWGIQNHSGALRTLPTDDLRRVLLPHAKATVTSEGIYFRGMLYQGVTVREKAAHLICNLLLSC